MEIYDNTVLAPDLRSRKSFTRPLPFFNISFLLIRKDRWLVFGTLQPETLKPY